MAIKKIFGLVLVIMTFTVLLGCCSATVYKVGDSDGWTAKDDKYYSWYERKEFHVGDSLVFEYDRNVNDVTQVSGASDYEFCNSSSPKAVYNTGHDVVNLTQAGYHYFITSNHGLCASGQKLDILVVRPRPILPFGKVFKVGDSKGWNVYNSEYYNKWSEEKQFYVGDNLFFEYNKDHNDVIEINGDLEFKSCDSTSRVAVYNTGHDLVKLTKPGVHYFVSLKTGLCEVGLKLRVMVQPLTKTVTFPNVPKKKIKLSPIDRLNRWLHTFRPHH
ncbi:Mavicyanin [Cardamine amara subsp. amara]|uniref:Mavicyanin n=1 Tax=Cardamine amara subsp. amara TaxID=228776 RepID=A0ABD1B841_CARAN